MPIEMPDYVAALAMDVSAVPERDLVVGGYYTAVQLLTDDVRALIAAIPHDYTDTAQAGAKHALEHVLSLLAAM